MIVIVVVADSAAALTVPAAVPLPSGLPFGLSVWDEDHIVVSVCRRCMNSSK